MLFMDPIQFIETAPLWLSMLALFFAAWIEYVFPPFPGDTLLVAGGFFVAQGIFPPILTFVVLTLGSVSGCLVGWSLGYHGLGLRRLIKPEYLEQISKGYEKYGVWVIIANRFVPGLRGAFMIGAGLVQMPARAIAIWGTISALIWNSVLIGLGYIFSDSLEKLLSVVQTYSKSVLFVVGLGVIAWLFFRMGRLRSYNHRPAQSSTESDTAK